MAEPGQGEARGRPAAVLITGGLGFVGAHLSRELRRRGRQVRVLSRRGWGAPRSAPAPGGHPRFPACCERERAELAGVEVVTGDLVDRATVEAALEGIQEVYHLAAVLGPGHLPAAAFEATNAGGTALLLQAVSRRRRPPRVVHVSTIGVLGHVVGRAAEVDEPSAPRGAYERSKWLAEVVAQRAARLGVAVCIVRPGWVYGPGDARMLRLFRWLARGPRLFPGAGRTCQHPTYVGDLVEGLLLAMERGSPGGVYHLGAEAPVEVLELCRRIAAALGAAPPRWRVPGILVRGAVLGVEALWRVRGVPPPVGRQNLAFFLRNRAFSIASASAALGFFPRVGLDEGLARTVRWYRDHGWLG